MKYSLVIFLFSCLFGYSQAKKEFTEFRLADIQAAKTLKDLVPSLPAECEIITCELSVLPKGGGVVITDVKGPKDKSWKILQRKAEPGTKIYIDVKKYSCPKALPKNYKILIIE